MPTPTCKSSDKTNNRGEQLVNFSVSTNLNIINQGSERTFVNSRLQTIIDLTLATEVVMCHHWLVSDEASCSDHSWIRFNLKRIAEAKPEAHTA